MKTTFRFIIAATAAISVFSSCQKELVNESANKTTDGVRTISVQFDNSTKASLSGFTPAFTNNDKIRVSNSTKSEECSVTVSGTTTTFTTTLSGALTAIYPEKAAVLASEASDAPIASSNNFKVSTSQTGELKDAIIAKATIAENSSVATFQGQTAVFRITPGAGTSTRYVEVITAGPEIANTATTEYTKKNKIHVATDDGDEVFVSVLVPDGGLKLRDLSFADGSKMKTVTDATKGATAINSNTIYTITNSGWDREYVEINGLKWATMNVGANSKTDAGRYFAWGYAEGCVRNTSGDGWVLASDNITEKQFNTEGFPNRDASSFKDAATANWGGSWRMPTGGTDAGDFIDLFRACGITSGYRYTPTSGGGTGTENKGVYWCDDYYDDDSGVEGAFFIAEDNGTPLFFPAAGHGDGTALLGETTGHKGYYL